MNGIERYLMWTAILVLIILVLLPRLSGYKDKEVERPSLMNTEEFRFLDPSLKRLYHKGPMNAIQTWTKTFNKWYKELSDDDMVQFVTFVTRMSDQQMTRAKEAAKRGGSDVLKDAIQKNSLMAAITSTAAAEVRASAAATAGVDVSALTPAPVPVPISADAAMAPAPVGSSGYMTQPSFLHMISGYEGEEVPPMVSGYEGEEVPPMVSGYDPEEPVATPAAMGSSSYMTQY